MVLKTTGIKKFEIRYGGLELKTPLASEQPFPTAIDQCLKY